MKRFYIQIGKSRYSVKVFPITFEHPDSDYNMGIQVKLVGRKLPIWGTSIKSTDNARKIAKEVISVWTEKKQ